MVNSGGAGIDWGAGIDGGAGKGQNGNLTASPKNGAVWKKKNANAEKQPGKFGNRPRTQVASGRRHFRFVFCVRSSRISLRSLKIVTRIVISAFPRLPTSVFNQLNERTKVTLKLKKRKREEQKSLDRTR